MHKRVEEKEKKTKQKGGREKEEMGEKRIKKGRHLDRKKRLRKKEEPLDFLATFHSTPCMPLSYTITRSLFMGSEHETKYLLVLYPATPPMGRRGACESLGMELGVSYMVTSPCSYHS